MAQTPQQIAAKWQQRTAGAVNEYKAGIAAVTTSPMEQAAAASDRYLAGVQRAVSSGKFANSLRRVSIQQWKDAATNKGANRLADGTKQAQPKMESFMAEWMPYVQRGQQILANMPKGGVENGINRAVQMIRYASEFRRSGS